jgi:hypothetical protein
MSSHVLARWAAGRGWLVAAFVVTAALCARVVLSQEYSTVTVSGPEGDIVDHSSFLESEGVGGALLVLVPVALSGLPMLVPAGRRRVAGFGCAALLMYLAVGMLGVGAFLIPGAMLLIIGAVRTTAPRPGVVAGGR